MNVTGWSRGLEVSGGGRGVVSHAGLALLRHLADKTGLTGGLSAALATPRILVHDRGRVLADLACAIADGARVISDFRVMSDQGELFGLVASVPTAWRTLAEIARAGSRADRRVTGAMNAARRHAWAQVAARHGALPGVRLADKVLDGVTCIRLDATVTVAHSDKQWAEGNFKGYGHHPLLAYCDNTGGEPLAWMLRRGSAGSNTAADHLALLDAAIAALPPGFRRKLMVTADGAGASHGLVARLDALAAAKVSVKPSLVREWLRAQAAGGYLDYDPATGTFTLPDAVAAAICHGPGGALVDAAATMFSSMGEGFAAFSEAFSTGQGFGWHQRSGGGCTNGCARTPGPTWSWTAARPTTPPSTTTSARLVAGQRMPHGSNAFTIIS